MSVAIHTRQSRREGSKKEAINMRERAFGQRLITDNFEQKLNIRELFKVLYMENRIAVEGFLNKLSKTGKLVIVEGVKDKKALQSFGVKNICCLNDRPLYKMIESVASANKEVIILTDLDREGRKLYGKLRTQLQFLGVEVDNYFREFLFRNTRIRQVEGLAGLCPANPRLAVVAESPVLMDFEDG